jgi:hypothetical protein
MPHLILYTVQEYYRKHSVPNRTPERRSRSLFSRMADMASSATSSSSSNPSSNRPGGHPNSAPRTNPQTRPSQQRGAAPPRPAGTRPGGTQQHQAHEQSQFNIPSNNPYSYQHPQPARFTRPRPSPNNASRPASADGNAGAGSRPGSTAPATPPRPPPPVPTVDALLEMTSEDIHGLSVGTLKSVLYEVSTSNTMNWSFFVYIPILAQLIRTILSLRGLRIMFLHHRHLKKTISCPRCSSWWIMNAVIEREKRRYMQWKSRRTSSSSASCGRNSFNSRLSASGSKKKPEGQAQNIMSLSMRMS